MAEDGEEQEQEQDRTTPMHKRAHLRYGAQSPGLLHIFSGTEWATLLHNVDHWPVASSSQLAAIHSPACFHRFSLPTVSSFGDIGPRIKRNTDHDE